MKPLYRVCLAIVLLAAAAIPSAVARTAEIKAGSDSASASVHAVPDEAAARALKLEPMLGRLFVPADFKSGAPPVALLSRTLWRELLRGQPSVIGSKVAIDGVDHVIIGIVRTDPKDSGGRQAWVARPRTN